MSSSIILSAYISHDRHVSGRLSGHISDALLSNPNNATSRPPPRVPRSLTLLMPTLAQIIRPRMHDNRPPQHTLRPNQLDQIISNAPLGVPLGISLEISKVANMTLGVFRGAMGFGKRVEVRAGGGAAVGVVAELVDVHAARGGGVVPADVVGDGRGGGFGGLFKGYGAIDGGITAEDCDCREERD